MQLGAYNGDSYIPFANIAFFSKLLFYVLIKVYMERKKLVKITKLSSNPESGPENPNFLPNFLSIFTKSFVNFTKSLGKSAKKFGKKVEL